MFIRAKKRGDRTYLQIVENHREGQKVVQQVIATLGRLDILQRTGQLDSLLKSGLRFTQRLFVMDAHAKGECTTTESKKIGVVLLFEKLWDESSIKMVIRSRLAYRHFEFALERVLFVTVLHRLICQGSDRSAEKWIRSYGIKGVSSIGLHHFYRAMAWLGEELPERGQHAKLLTVQRIKDRIEEDLFALRRTLFTDIDLVFFDTTSLYFEGDSGQKLGRRGKSKDHRPDLKQMVVGIVLDGHGNPICSEIVPGNTTDVTTLVPVAERLKKRFGILRVCIVADRGMISERTIGELERLGWQYILGARLRKVKEIRENVLIRGGRFREVYPERRKSRDPAPLKVKEVRIENRRYIVCHNEEEARKDRYDRQAIVSSLYEKLKQGDKSLVGNKGYRRFLKCSGKRFEIDESRIEFEERFDGKWVLRTNTDLDSAEVALKYKQLWIVEDIFRTMKSILETRPIFHHWDETITGHVFCSFLALVLRKNLQDRIETHGWKLEWADIVRDVDAVEEITVTHQNKSFILRTETQGVAGKVFQAAGVALPPVLREAEMRGTTPVPSS